LSRTTAPPPEGRGGPPSGLPGSIAFLARHQATLWWLHSTWALACGVAVMWIGTHHFTFVRVAVVYVALIWLVSLFSPKLLAHPSVAGRAHWLRLGVNYVSRNFYQQVLFFVLPIYYASATLTSANMLFVGLVAMSAIISTLDVVYDRHLSTNRDLVAAFFACNLFACLTAAVPIVWQFGPSMALRISAALSFVEFASFYFGRPVGTHPKPWVGMLAVVLLLALVITRGQRLVPPVPMRLSGAAFGDQVERQTLQMATRFQQVPAGWSGTLDVVTAIDAPMGLTESVRHRWRIDGITVRTTAAHQVSGGRKEGFRLWTALPIASAPQGARISVDVETNSGQLIGRAAIRVGR
jgi:Family of unknown function (DUF5924)